MVTDRKQKPSNSIPIHFVDGEDSGVSEARRLADDDQLASDPGDELLAEETDRGGGSDFGGPDLAELIASRAELKRLEAALAEAQEALARRQADFENYRKRVERERSETQRRIAGDVAQKLLPVVDNLSRALDAERTVEARESNEFRHFLHGVELISKQLNDVLESLGIQPIPSVGQRFDPHVHEAVVTELSEKYEPDTVIEEITRGYKIGDRLVRPAMVKVAAHKRED